MIDSGGWQRRRIIWDVSTGMNMITFPDPVGNGLLAQEDETGEYLLYHFNNIGSTSAVTDMDGTIVHAYSYGTYGELLSGNREGIRFLYNGRYGVVTDENGLYYMRARYYNVDIKRFINQDVVEGSIATSPSLNQYAYCQGNPVKLTDPFGLSPFTSWSVLGHGLLDVLGFIPVIGAIPDTVNALWYLAEGDHFSAAASFVSAVPGWGDVIGAVGKTAKGCSKVSKMVRYGSKIVGRIGNIALGSYQTGSIAVSLYDKHVVQGESWDWDSTVQLFSAGLFATTTVVSAKGLKGDVGEYRRVVGKNDNASFKSPSEIAQSWQGSGKYPGIDRYRDITIKEGMVIYRGEPNGTEYFTTKSAIERSGKKATKIFEGLQVEKNPIHGYRGNMQGYKTTKDIRVAYGITKANPQFGQGGLPQIFVPEAERLIRQGILMPVNNITLFK